MANQKSGKEILHHALGAAREAACKAAYDVAREVAYKVVEDTLQNEISGSDLDLAINSDAKSDLKTAIEFGLGAGFNNGLYVKLESSFDIAFTAAHAAATAIIDSDSNESKDEAAIAYPTEVLPTSLNAEKVVWIFELVVEEGCSIRRIQDRFYRRFRMIPSDTVIYKTLTGRVHKNVSVPRNLRERYMKMKSRSS